MFTQQDYIEYFSGIGKDAIKRYHSKEITLIDGLVYGNVDILKSIGIQMK